MSIKTYEPPQATNPNAAAPVVRPMAERDVARVSRMFIRLFEYFDALGFPFKLKTERIEEHVRAQLDARLSRVFVLEADGEAAGFVGVSAPLMNKLYKAESAKHTGLISELFVEPDYRGKGYARQLIQAAEFFLRGLGVDCVRVDVVAHNDVAKDLYEASGFEAMHTTLIKQLEA